MLKFSYNHTGAYLPITSTSGPVVTDSGVAGVGGTEFESSANVGIPNEGRLSVSSLAPSPNVQPDVGSVSGAPGSTQASSTSGAPSAENDDLMTEGGPDPADVLPQADASLGEFIGRSSY
jgi:hypothetical protein